MLCKCPVCEEFYERRCVNHCFTEREHICKECDAKSKVRLEEPIEIRAKY